MKPELSAPQTLVEHLPEEWEALLRQWGEPRFRALQVFRWIHQRGVLDPEQMTDLPKALRARLAEGGLAAPVEVARVLESGDGTRKLLCRLGDGREVESVLIPRGAVAAADIYAPQQDDEDGPQQGAPRAAVTQCISSQVGCAMGCSFCASGIAGLKRQMTAGEIIAQVIEGRRVLGEAARLSGVVLMGMGEPLHNYPAVARALTLLNHPEGIRMSLRRVTLSTSGLVDGIERLGRDFGGQVGLAVSVHAPADPIRTRLMPVNRRHPLQELIAALRAYPLPPHRRITVEYTLIAGINDAPEHARALCERLRGIAVKVNLIPMNPVPESPLGAPSDGAVEGFQRTLRQHGVDVFVRRRKGDDIAAACGQLALHGEKAKVRTHTG
ncbi:MAG: 23S rRNA (adenine(2503)-C(2))-methyltransferase RlmN [Myxococcales bacterium]|nr:23S rRNA (adenine(2503)-C(2))-methyltransferase RlmN [Myxococcales bacterium]